MGQLHGQVEHHHANQQRSQRGAAEAQRQPGQGEQQQTQAGGLRATPAVGHAPGLAGGQCTDRTDHAEQADHSVGIAIGLGRQQEGQRRPEHREHGEAQAAEQCAQAEFGLVAEQQSHRGHQARIADAFRVAIARQGEPQGQCGDRHHRRRQQVYAAPVAQRGQRAGHRARQQDAQQQAAHQRADHPSALLRRGQGRRERHQHLGDHREHPGQRSAQQQHREARRQRTEQQAAGDHQGHADDQPPSLQQVAQRHQQDQADGIADLGGGDEDPSLGIGEVELLGQSLQQRLVVVVAGHRHAGGEGHQQDQPAAQIGGWVFVHRVGLAGWGGSIGPTQQ
ncbi:hypothetical protein D3C78_891500 [compost metagenome]